MQREEFIQRYFRPYDSQEPVPELSVDEATIFLEDLAIHGLRSTGRGITGTKQSLSARALVRQIDTAPNILERTQPLIGPSVLIDPSTGEAMVYSGGMLYEDRSNRHDHAAGPDLG